jgi:hypothetical protein
MAFFVINNPVLDSREYSIMLLILGGMFGLIMASAIDWAEARRTTGKTETSHTLRWTEEASEGIYQG